MCRRWAPGASALKIRDNQSSERDRDVFFAGRLASMPKSIAPLIACRLIALNKNPGDHPIGIGEMARRINISLPKQY